jgi:hypothetical protein
MNQFLIDSTIALVAWIARPPNAGRARTVTSVEKNY